MEKVKNIRLDTKLGLREAKLVAEQIFQRIEAGEVDLNKDYPIKAAGGNVASTSQRRANAKNVVKTTGKVVGAVGAGTVYVGLRTIFKLMKKYE